MSPSLSEELTRRVADSTEVGQFDQRRVERAVRELLLGVGRERLANTPAARR
jgi:hypothetical protein